METYALIFDLQEIKIKSGAVFLCFDVFHSLNFAANIVIVFHHYKWQSFDIGRSYPIFFVMKTVLNTHLSHKIKIKPNIFQFMMSYKYTF